MLRKRDFSIFEKILLWGLSICCIASIMIYFIRFINFRFTDDPNDFGIFGDYIGGVVGTIVGLIGIIFLYRTYLIQISIFEIQDKRQCQQQFESTFFTLLSQQRNIFQNMQGEYPASNNRPDFRVKGSQYVALLRLDLSLRLLDLGYESELLARGDARLLKIHVNNIYQVWFQGHAAQLGHYFRHLYHVLKYIDDSQIEDKKKYSDLVQAQMSTDELYLTAINGISNYGRKKMLPLLNSYSFLENLVIDDDPIISDLIKIFYPKTKRKNIIDVNRNIIFLGGIHAVGKSFFANSIRKEHPSIGTMSCSEVLKWEDPRSKEVDDVVENQDRLINNLQRIVDIDKPYLLDGHFCLINAAGEIECVPLYVFRAINPEFIILLKESVDIIVKRLLERDNKKYRVEIIERLLEKEREWAMDVADALGVPMYEIKSSEYDKIKDAVAQFVDSFC